MANPTPSPRDLRVRQLYKLRKSMLLALYYDRRPGVTWHIGGPKTWNKETLIKEILQVEGWSR